MENKAMHLTLENVDIHFPIFAQASQSLRHKLVSAASNGRYATSGSTILSKALTDVCLDIRGGDKVGLIGPNGAGKSTLLRAMAGIYEPTRGTMSVSGITTLIADLGLGFDEDASGARNIYLASILMGVERKQTVKLFEEIVSFSGLGDAIHMPLRTYSSGMRMRLAFSIAVSREPDILLIDEVFGAGDASFIDKSVVKLKELIGNSKIFVFATHSTDLMMQFCNKCVFMEGGFVKFYGPIEEGLELYMNDIEERKSA